MTSELQAQIAQCSTMRWLLNGSLLWVLLWEPHVAAGTSHPPTAALALPPCKPALDLTICRKYVHSEVPQFIRAGL